MKIINLPFNEKLDDFIVKNGKGAFDVLITKAEEYDLSNKIKAEINSIRAINMKSFERNKRISEIVINRLKEKGKFLLTSISPLYFSDETSRTYEFDDGRFIAFINDKFGINASEVEWEYLSEQLRVEAVQRGQKVEIKKVSYYDKENHKLYISNFNGGIYLLDGKIVQLVPNGADGVLFKDRENWEPYQYETSHQRIRIFDHLLIHPINFHDAVLGGLTAKELRLLWKIYVYALFFEELMPSKPLVVFVGEHGAGKSTALRSLLRFLFGPKVTVFSLSKKKEDAFLATICNEHFVVLDNVDDRIDWLNDHLASIATGGGVPLRKLYTTNEILTFSPRVYITLTSRTPQFKREDVVDRMLLFPVERIKNFIADSQIEDGISKKRNLLWTEIINDLNSIVASFEEHYEHKSSVNRIADFSQLGANLANWMKKPKTFQTIMNKLTLGHSSFMLQDDPLFDLLEAWVGDRGNEGREVLAGDLHSDFQDVAMRKKVPYVYPSPRSLGRRLNNIIPSLRQFFDITINDKGGNKRYYVFKNKRDIKLEGKELRKRLSKIKWPPKTAS